MTIQTLVRPKNDWILDNAYFTGAGAEGKQKLLSERGCLAVLDNVSDELAASGAMNRGLFMDEHCSTQKHAEIWLARKVALYGTELTQQAVFTRCEDFLRSNRARGPIRSCMKHKSPLESASPPGRELN